MPVYGKNTTFTTLQQSQPSRPQSCPTAMAAFRSTALKQVESAYEPKAHILGIPKILQMNYGKN